MSSEFDGRDLAVGAAFGIRRWKVDSLGRLLGNSYTCGIWRPGENQAVCRKDFDDGYLKSFNYVTFNYTTPLSIQSSSASALGATSGPKSELLRDRSPSVRDRGNSGHRNALSTRHQLRLRILGLFR
jgi:hypothetical protein